jgi:two-component system OmpR family response regulator
MGKRIAIVEDEPAIRDNYADVLRKQGYEVETWEDRASAMAAFQTRLPDLVLLDIGLKDEIDAGFDICRDLRAKSASLPIIFLTARDSDFDTIAGLRLGADDYLTKDISLPHLIARIAAFFRRLDIMENPPEQETSMRRGELELDLNRFTASWQGKSVDLTLTEFWMVHALAKHPGHVRKREQLMGDANIYVDDSTITSHIKRIRRKFSLLDQDFNHIETVYGMGYRWLE